MAYDADTDATGDFPEEKMIRKPPQINPSPISRSEMEPSRIGSRFVDERIQLLPELVAQAVVDAVVVAQNSGDVSLNGGVVNHLHRPRFCWTRRTNSSCEIAATCPDSNSRSLRSISSSETSVPGGGKVSRSLVANAARSGSDRASAACSISASFMPSRYKLSLRLATLVKPTCGVASRRDLLATPQRSGDGATLYQPSTSSQTYGCTVR